MALALGAAALGLWQAQGRKERATTLESQTAPVIRKDVQLTVSATGTIRPLTPVNLSLIHI